MLIVGSPVSPYVRKVMVALALKGVDYELDPIVPFMGNDEFGRISPLRRVPVLIDGDLILNDSTVICEYLDEACPGHALLPRHPADRARARWLEEYADSRLGDLIIWRLFFACTVAPRLYKREPDPADVARIRDVELPAALDWIEAQAPAEGFLFDAVGIADIAYAAFFRNATLTGFAIDPARWPRTAAWVARVEAVPAFAATLPMEHVIMTARTHERNDALRAIGVRVAEKSFGGRSPQSSIMLGEIAVVAS
ncbi:MAG: glutathione S-transferase family protein [Sphingomonas sp.]